MERMTDDFSASFVATTTPLSALIVHFFSDQWGFPSTPLFLKTSLVSGLFLLAYILIRAWPWYRALNPEHRNGNRK
ncbi:MAG: hypothetical protein ACKV19_21925 [Verrucomicrobiales bacterium]